MVTDNRNDKITDVLPLINHPIRVDIIKLLYSEPKSFTDLLKYLSISSTSKLSFHLNKLENIVIKNDEGVYMLSDLGKKTYRLLISFENEKLTDNSGSFVGRSKIDISITARDLSSYKKIVFNKIHLLIAGINPAILIFLIPLFLIPLLNIIFTLYLDNYNRYDNYSMEYVVVYFIIFYVPLLVYILLVHHYKFPAIYSIIGGLIILVTGFFFMRNEFSDFYSTYESNPVKDRSLLFWIGLNLFRGQHLNINIIFMLTLLFFSSLYIVAFVYPLKRISCGKIAALDETKPRIPGWIEILTEKKLLILLSAIYLVLLILSNEKRAGVSITYTWDDLAWGVTTRTLTIDHYVLPPFGYIIPSMIIVVILTLLIYTIIKIDRVSSLYKTMIGFALIVVLPLWKSLVIFGYFLNTHDQIEFISRYISVTLLEFNITGELDFLIVHLFHVLLEIIVTAVFVALFLKFLIYGSKYKRSQLEHVKL
ncbi:MAG: winged helix-turn-helix domain-containing protein [Candidatus Hodarchaeales archaeon]